MVVSKGFYKRLLNNRSVELRTTPVPARAQKQIMLSKTLGWLTSARRSHGEATSFLDWYVCPMCPIDWRGSMVLEA